MEEFVVANQTQVIQSSTDLLFLS